MRQNVRLDGMRGLDGHAAASAPADSGVGLVSQSAATRIRMRLDSRWFALMMSVVSVVLDRVRWS
ncbi:MAG: hypothetical protein FWD57_04595 [Polyangiaceae bacterium]|nr:hypothetical protein [Polyangiaceae bacterium]